MTTHYPHHLHGLPFTNQQISGWCNNLKAFALKATARAFRQLYSYAVHGAVILPHPRRIILGSTLSMAVAPHVTIAFRAFAGVATQFRYRLGLRASASRLTGEPLGFRRNTPLSLRHIGAGPVQDRASRTTAGLMRFPEHVPVLGIETRLLSKLWHSPQ
jgi:hypothetical protein